MASWACPKDGRIVPNDYLHPQDATTATTATTATNTTTTTNADDTDNADTTVTGDGNYSAYSNPVDATGTSVNINTDTNFNTAADDLDYFESFVDSVSGFDNLAYPALTILRRHLYTQTNLTNNASLFTLVDNTRPSVSHAAPSTSFPHLSIHVSDRFHDPFCLSPSQPPLSVTSAPRPAYQGHHSNFGPLGQPIPDFDDCRLHEARHNQQHLSATNLGGNPHYSTEDPPLPLATTFPPRVNPTISQQAPVQQFGSLPSLPEVREFEDIRDITFSTLPTQDLSYSPIPSLNSSPPPPQATVPFVGPRTPPATGSRIPFSSHRKRIPGRPGVVGAFKEEAVFPVPNSGIGSEIPIITMPSTMKTRSGANESPGRKRKASVTSPSTRPNKTRRKATPFGNSQPSVLDDDCVSKPAGFDDVETVDLSNATEVPAELMAPKADNRVKLGRFQCVICMDNTTALTVTHCGHLFCSECLHSSLHIDSMKRTCPVCRSKIDCKDKKGKTVKSYHHLELKIMTATRKGKRPVNP